MSDNSSSIETYVQELRMACKGGEDIPDIILEVPNIFCTMQRLLKDEDLDNDKRLMVFAALGYFFIPDDLFPEEELGQIGYIDDVILCLTIFQEIAETPLGKFTLRRNWELTGALDEVLGPKLDQLITEYPKHYVKVLDHVGLLPNDVDLDIY